MSLIYYLVNLECWIEAEGIAFQVHFHGQFYWRYSNCSACAAALRHLGPGWSVSTSSRGLRNGWSTLSSQHPVDAFGSSNPGTENPLLEVDSIEIKLFINMIELSGIKILYTLRILTSLSVSSKRLWKLCRSSSNRLERAIVFWTVRSISSCRCWRIECCESDCCNLWLYCCSSYK